MRSGSGTVSLPALAEALGIGGDRTGRGSKAYEDATPGSRPPRGRGGRQVWIAGDFRAGEFRSRREALKHCPAGVAPLLVTVDRREVEA